MSKTITLTDRFGVKRRLRLKRRRQGPSFRISKTRRNIERPRLSDHPRLVHSDDYTHQREDDHWIDVHPRRVHSDEQVRSRRDLSDESLRAHRAPYDDDIPRSSEDKDARKKEKKVKKEKKAKKENKAKEEKKKEGWLAGVSRMLFPTQGNADVQEVMTPSARSETTIRRTSQYVQDVRKKRNHGKHHHKDKLSKKETEKHARVDQLDTRNLAPPPYLGVPAMNLQRPSDVSVARINDSDVSLDENTDARKKKSETKTKTAVGEGVESNSGGRKSKLPAIDDDEEASEFEANELEFWAGQIAARKSLQADMRKLNMNIGQDRSAQQRSNNNVGNSYPSMIVPDDTLVTILDEPSRHRWSYQDEATTADVRTMGEERFRMIREAFETGTSVSYVCD